MLKAHERIDCLIKENLKVIQNDDVFSFSTDALLLGYFTEVRKRYNYGFVFWKWCHTATIICERYTTNRCDGNTNTVSRYGASKL